MIDMIPRPVKDRCECGALLTWESRGAHNEKRWLALCANPECGVITTESAQDPESTLQTLLLGDVPVARYLRPWARFYFRATTWGYRWRPHAEGCRECGNELVAALDIDWRPDRPGDPRSVVLCTGCGSTETAFWINGETVSLWTAGSAWEDSTPPIQALKHALEDRAENPDPADGYTWDFR